MQIIQLSIILALTSSVTAVWRCVTCDNCPQFPHGWCASDTPEQPGQSGNRPCNSNAPCLTHDNNDVPNRHWCAALDDGTATCT